MGGRKDNRAFTAMWRRIMSDPLLPRLQTAYARNDVPSWRVRDGRIVVDPPADPALGREPASSELPIPPNELIGRKRECARVQREVLQARLVTLTGLAGVGKTRVALQVANDLDKAFPGGAVWVDLAGTADPEMVIAEVSARLGVQQGSAVFTPGEHQEERLFVQRLADKLRDRSLLLVLDNCEPVLAGCRELIEALRSCAEVRILCTSREAIGSEDECVLVLDPLPVPSSHELGVQEALSWDAVALFLERANPEGAWPLRDADVPVVVQICQRLEGVPYAIELAAAKVGVVPLEEILDRLHHLRPTGDPPSQATIGWSYHLLSPLQQLLLRRLSVFRGGFGLDAAGLVCAGHGLTRPEVRATLNALLDTSLVFREPYHTPARLGLLETTREYAMSQLATSNEVAHLRASHRAWVRRLTESMEPRLQGPAQVEALDEMELELDNIRAALESSDREGAADRLRIACALQRFWMIRGLLSEGRVHLSRALAAVAEDSREYAWGASVASKLANYDGDLDAARRYAEEGLRGCRAAHDRSGEALALLQLGIEAHQRGRLAEAEMLCVRSLAISRERSNAPAAVLSLYRLGGIAESLGDFERAGAAYEEALATSRSLDDTFGIALSVYWLGRLSAHQGRFGEAKELLEEGLLLSKRLGCRQLTVLNLIGIGTAAYLRGDWALAETHLLEGFQMAHNLEDRTSLLVCVAGLADVELAQGKRDAAARWLAGHEPHDALLGPLARASLLGSQARLAQASGDTGEAVTLHRAALALWHRLRELRHLPEHIEELALIALAGDDRARAATLLAAAHAYRKTLGFPVPHVQRTAVDHARERLRGPGEPPEIRSAWNAGAAMTVQEALACALSA